MYATPLGAAWFTRCLRAPGATCPLTLRPAPLTRNSTTSATAAELPGLSSLGATAIEVRSRALLSEGEVAEGLDREAIDRLGLPSCVRTSPLAHLLCGERLRRENRRGDARERLRTAYDMFAAMGADGFADRARRELLATGETVRKRRDDTSDELTPRRSTSPDWPETDAHDPDHRN